MQPIGRQAAHRMASFVLVCFFVSGLTGLIYEVLWTRMIVQIIGGAPFAVSIVLTVFMGGLGLGSYLASRTIDRVTQTLKLVRLYGLLELAVGAYCLAMPLLLRAFRPLYASLYNRLFEHFVLYTLLTYAGCILLLVAPVICMGATLPILCRFYVTRLSHLSTHTGRLYGVNTLGAAIGALLCGFWLIELLGVTGTLALAVITNAVIGLACLWISTQVTSQPSPPQPERHRSGRSVEELLPGDGSPRTVAAALVVFAISGFCAMAYEVIWTKLLGLMVGPTTYSFTLVLVTFITCLALGSILFGWIGDRVKSPMHLLLHTQLAAALLALLISQILGNSQLFFAKLLYHGQNHFALVSVLKAGSIFALMLWPTLLLGATFPLVGKIYTQSISSVGRSVGVAYAVNTVGAVLGSFCAGFVLIPLLGKEKSLSLIISLQILTSLVVYVLITGKAKGSVRRLAPLAMPALLGLLLCLRYPIWNRHLLSLGRYQRFSNLAGVLDNIGWLDSMFRGTAILQALEKNELLYYGDGIGGFTTVLKCPPSILGEPTYVMVNSGKGDASSQGDMNTQTLLAHMPMLFHPSPKEVMVLGLASGITAGEVLHYPIDRLDVLEISQQVVEASRFFLPWNNNVLSDPRTDLIIQDGRAHLQLTRRTYDVIISEPSNPWMAGLATLFTREFFTLARDRLHSDGILVQWLQAYSIDWPTFALIGRTFAEVFPNSALIRTNPSGISGDCLLVGFKGGNGLVLDHAKRNLAYAQRSRNVAIVNPEVLYRLIISEDLRSLFGQGLVNTDAHPWLEFAAPRLLSLDKDPAIPRILQQEARVHPDTQERVNRVCLDVDAQIDFAACAFSVELPFAHMVDLSKANSVQRERFLAIVEKYVAHSVMDFSLIGDASIEQRCRMIQIRAIRDRIDSAPNKAGLYLLMADLYIDMGMIHDAVTQYQKILQVQPNAVQAMNNLAWRMAIHPRTAFYNPQEAVRLAELACSLTHYRSADMMDTLGVAYAATGQFLQAETVTKSAMQLLLASGQEDKAKETQTRLILYAARRPYVESLPKAP